jgi:hypothetical protein
MSALELDCYGRHLRGVAMLLEFGVGGSTLFALAAGIAEIHGVESSREWIERLQADEQGATAIRTGKLHLHWADIGPIGDWGMPLGEPSAVWPRYYLDIWQSLDPSKLDLALVDGRFRVACILTALLYSQAKIAVHDFWDRPHYHCVLPFVAVRDRIETLAVLTPRPDADVREMSRMLLDHLYDAR